MNMNFASSVEKRIQELIKWKINIHRLDRLVISDVDGSNNKSKKLYHVKYSTFPPVLDEMLTLFTIGHAAIACGRV